MELKFKKECQNLGFSIVAMPRVAIIFFEMRAVNCFMYKF